MTGFKLILTLAVLALFSIACTPTAQACDDCGAKAAVTTVAQAAIAPARVAQNVVAGVIQNRPRLLGRTVTVTIPTVATDSCGQVTNVGCTTACVKAVLLPRLKARRLANGHTVQAQASSVQTVLVQ